MAPIKLAFAASAFALLCGAAQAQTRHRDPAAAFAQTDANKDGSISRGEYVASRSARFTQLDRNKDGVVSTADFQRLAAYPDAMAKLEALLDEADANKDKKVTRDELARAPTPAFTRADANKDGKVSQSELAALRTQRPRQ